MKIIMPRPMKATRQPSANFLLLYMVCCREFCTWFIVFISTLRQPLRDNYHIHCFNNPVDKLFHTLICHLLGVFNTRSVQYQCTSEPSSSSLEPLLQHYSEMLRSETAASESPFLDYHFWLPQWSNLDTHTVLQPLILWLRSLISIQSLSLSFFFSLVGLFSMIFNYSSANMIK